MIVSFFVKIYFKIEGVSRNQWHPIIKEIW